MANKKFSEFVLKTSTSDVSHIVGYNGAENVQITPANFVTGGGTGVFLPLAGGTMTGNTIHNDNVKSIYGTSGDGLEIFHDGTDSFISDTGTGNLLLRAASNFEIEDSDGTNMARFLKDNKVELYYDGSIKLETTSVGASVLSDTATTLLINADTHSASVQSTAKLQLGFAHSGSPQAFGHIVLQETANNSFDGTLIFSAPQNNGSGGSVTVDCFNIKGSDKSATFSGNVTIASTASPVLTLQDTDATATFNKTEIQNSAGSLLFNTRQSNGTFVSTDYLQSKSTTGAITHQWFTSGTEKMRLDNSGNLGLGTSTPDSKMHIQDGSAGTVTASSEADLVVESSLDTAINLLTPDNRQSAIYFGSVSDTIGCQVSWKHSVKDLVIGTAVTSGGEIAFRTGNNVEKMRLSSAGEIQFGTGSNNGGFLDFDGTSVQLNTQRNPNTGAFVDTAKSNASINLVGADGGSYIRFSTNDANNATANERVRITPAGNLSIGTTGDNHKLTISDAVDRAYSTAQLSIEGNGYQANHFLDNDAYTIQQNSSLRDLKIVSSTNGVLLTAGATAWTSASDETLKENIKPLENVLDKIKDYRCVEYNFKNDKNKKIGFIAQDWQKDFEPIVDKDKEGLLSMKYTETIPVLLKAIQELSAKLEALECQCEKK